ncbi:MAG: NAD-dependent epimerase/dehydratase family protein [Myxococcota bacterium]|nr:NAD-dependent epimerase/dehydratase family protein [Myxococcota bacterium]
MVRATPKSGGKSAPVVLVTGASGEIGRALLKALAGQPDQTPIVTVDAAPLRDDMRSLVAASYLGDVSDRAVLDDIAATHDLDTIYHLAALLSARGERHPELAHRVNVEGTLNVLRTAHSESYRKSRSLRVVFPSSIAVYGLPTRRGAQRARSAPVREQQWNCPSTMYGCNKLYCEHLGRYYAFHAGEALAAGPRLDFRALRLPGLLAADTLPSGGTSDFGSEILHAAARGVTYDCFVGADATLPFMAMPDAVRALIELAGAERTRLSSCVYNVSGFSVSAGAIAERVRKAFPGAKVSFAPDPQRAGIVASWPETVDDRRARADWGWKPTYDWERAFSEYLAPGLFVRYGLVPKAGPDEK